MYKVLLLLLLPSSLNQVTAACSLCSGGEAITKPEYVLDLTDPVPVKSCQDLVNLLAFIQEEDELCLAARALSTICGCPKILPNACTICGNNMTRPLQNLDGLVDLGDVDFFGLSPTCALVESGINLFHQDEEACSILPMDDLQAYCGCPSNENTGGGNSETECTLCPGGEIVPDLPGNEFVVLTLNSNGNRIGCSEAQQLAKEEERGSVLCNDIQKGSTACGCPQPENACQLCPDGGEVVLNFKRVDSIFGLRQDCDSFSHQLHRYDRDSAECLSLEESYREECGCKKEEFVPCAVCPGGESVAYPDKEIVGIEGLGFDYLDLKCGTIEQAAALTDEKDPACSSARILGKVCGCPVPETGCNLCGAGNAISNPYGEYQWEWGSVRDAYGSFFSEDLNLGDRKFRCELADSFMSLVYDANDQWCYYNQLIRATACGCDGPNTSKAAVLVWMQRCSGILSLIGSLSIILFVITKKEKNRWNTYNQIVLAISVFDSLSSLAYIFGTALTPADIGIYGSVGNEGTCVFQGAYAIGITDRSQGSCLTLLLSGWLFQIGVTSVYYNVVLCFYFIIVVKYNWRESKFKKVRKWVHLGVLTVGVTMSLAVIPFVTADWRWCYLSTPPYYESWLPGIFFFILPIGICMLGMTVLMALFVKYVRQVENKSKKRKLSGNSPKRQSLATRTFWQSFYFLTVFYTVWPIQFVAFIIPLVEENYWVYVLAALLGPLQGFLNAMVVFYRDRKALSKYFLRLLGIEYIKERWSTVFSGFFKAKASTDSKLSEKRIARPISGNTDSKASSVEHNAPLNEQKHVAMKSEKGLCLQTVEEPISEVAGSGAVSQSDAGALQNPSQGGANIDTSLGVDAVFLNDNEEGHPQSSRDGVSDAMLEFAMNAGLLTDDDYVLYHDSINRLEEISSRDM